MATNVRYNPQRPYRTLRLILGDQLNEQHSWFTAHQQHSSTLYVMMEVRSETDYTVHHIQKILGFFVAMRSFAGRLEELGCTVRYYCLDDADNQQSLTANILTLCRLHGVQCFEYQAPDEYRVDEELRLLCSRLAEDGIESRVCDTEHFLSARDEVAALFKGKKTYLLETFYRAMRRKHRILMNPENPQEPLTGRWNYDADNRQKLPIRFNVPPPKVFIRDVSALEAMIRTVGVRTIGSVNPRRFFWACTRSEALELLEHFTTTCLPHFGTYQDAMAREHWSLFHSRLSFVLNLKLISPKEVVERCVEEWEHRCTAGTTPQEKVAAISIGQIEGFVRQIIGWREYMRGVYWAQMPEYKTLNYFQHTAALPSWFWTGKTHMACVRHAIEQSLHYGYAHHIQRLMLTGNIALLLGVHPDEVDSWYLGIYIDALEWVEITNTRGMSQFADGGVVGTKPYVSSARYIDKMSNYCSHCGYDRTKRYEADAAKRPACPFNSLYWDFYHRHRALLERNPRIGMMYKTLDRMSKQELRLTLAQAEAYKCRADEL
jgi:deoxyribodipyrimidine photolyase-related protein